MKLVVMLLVALCCSHTDGFGVPTFLRWSGDTVSSDQGTQKGLSKNPFITPMWTRFSHLTKGASVEYTTIPVIVGTKAELVELKRVLEGSKVVPENSIDFDPDGPDDKIISASIRVGDLTGQTPANDAALLPEAPKNATCETSVADILPLLRQHPIPTLVHDNPEMILSMIQALVPKPESFAMQPEIELPPSSKKLISLAVRNPDWVMSLITAEPTILIDMLGLGSTSETGSDETMAEEA